MIPMAWPLTYCGLAAICFAMPSHWRKLAQGAPRPRTSTGLRIAGSLALLLSLVTCFQLHGFAIGSLVWLAVLSITGLVLIGLVAWTPRSAALLCVGGPMLVLLMHIIAQTR